MNLYYEYELVSNKVIKMSNVLWLSSVFLFFIKQIVISFWHDLCIYSINFTGSLPRDATRKISKAMIARLNLLNINDNGILNFLLTEHITILNSLDIARLFADQEDIPMRSIDDPVSEFSIDRLLNEQSEVIPIRLNNPQVIPITSEDDSEVVPIRLLDDSDINTIERLLNDPRIIELRERLVTEMTRSRSNIQTMVESGTLNLETLMSNPEIAEISQNIMNTVTSIQSNNDTEETDTMSDVVHFEIPSNNIQIDRSSDVEIETEQNIFSEGVEHRYQPQENLINEIKDKSETKKNNTECIICASNPINCIIYPCKHIYMCMGCSKSTKKCAICRDVIISKHQVWIS